MYRQIFPADLNYLHKILDFIQTYAQEKNISSAIISKIILATEEAVVNIINYGYPNTTGSIEINCLECLDKQGIMIQIKDQGIPFNPTTQYSLKEVSEEFIDHLELGGYGINIFIRMMDRVEYQRLEKDNLLSLIKYL